MFKFCVSVCVCVNVGAGAFEDQRPTGPQGPGLHFCYELPVVGARNRTQALLNALNCRDVHPVSILKTFM